MTLAGLRNAISWHHEGWRGDDDMELAQLSLHIKAGQLGTTAELLKQRTAEASATAKFIPKSPDLHSAHVPLAWMEILILIGHDPESHGPALLSRLSHCMPDIARSEHDNAPAQWRNVHKSVHVGPGFIYWSLIRTKYEP